MASQEARNMAARFVNAPNPTAYYNGLSEGRKRLVNAGLSAAGLVRVKPYVRPQTPTQRPITPTPPTPPTPRPPRGRRQFVGQTHRTTTSQVKVDINGRIGTPIPFQNAIAQTYYLTLTPNQPINSNVEIRELLGRQRYPMYNPNRMMGVRVKIDFESGATKGASIPIQTFMSQQDLIDSVVSLLISGYNRYGAIAQIEIEVIVF